MSLFCINKCLEKNNIMTWRWRKFKEERHRFYTSNTAHIHWSASGEEVERGELIGPDKEDKCVE